MTFLARVRSGLKKKFFTSCWVMVLPPLFQFPFADIVVGGPQYTPRVNTAVGEKIPVLNCQQGFNQGGGDIIVGNQDAVLVVVGVDPADQLRLDTRQGQGLLPGHVPYLPHSPVPVPQADQAAVLPPVPEVELAPHKIDM